MKISIELDKKRIIVLSAVLMFLLVVSVVTVDAQKSRRTQQQPQESPSIAAQFGGSFVCMISQCGWPALVFLILPAIAVFIWKKIFSVG